MERSEDLAVEATRLKAKLFRAGLHRTANAMDKVTKLIGWEMAEKMRAGIKASKRAMKGNPTKWHLSRDLAEYCSECDGCGWYEGGKTLKTACKACGGSGLVCR